MKLFSELMKKTGEVFVEIRGRERVLAEGCCKIESYTDERIVLSSNKGSISVRGGELLIRHLSDERVAVEGRIDSVEFL